MKTEMSSGFNAAVAIVKGALLADGRIDLAETAFLLRLVRPAAERGVPEAVELERLLLEVREDGVVDPGESAQIVAALERIAALSAPSPGRPAQVQKTYLSADELLRDAWRLAARVKASGWRPDVLVALWRGGASVGVAMHEFLKVSGWDLRHIPLKCASYSGIGENAGDVVFTLGEEVFGLLRPGDRVLVVDDVFDTGKTAKAVRARLDAVGAEMRLATVYWKPEKNTTDLKPDYFVRDVGGDWIVFPHEIEGLTPEETARKDPELAKLLGTEP